MTMSEKWKNQLFFGDNLDILKQLHAEHPQGFIDLIYIDPPFNSKRNYNVLFESIDLKDSTAQKEAFADTWTNVSYMDMLNELSDLDISLFRFLQNLDNCNISKGAISYLVTMAIRLWYMHKLLKPTGSFYLHCDPTMSHYLKILCDLIFGEKHFKNEIIWKRSTPHATATKKFNVSNDIIFFYSKSDDYIWNKQYEGYREEYVKKYYSQKENDRFFQPTSLLGHQGVNKIYDWQGFEKPWRYPKHRLDELNEQGLIYFPEKGGMPRLKRFLDEQKGQLVESLWIDIPPVNSQAIERLGYPTQKPEALLERIINASTNEQDLVADFFCGCGTSVTVAEKLNRRWMGVDISHLAVRLIAKRLVDSYGDEIEKTFEIHGFPKDLDSAHELANKVKGGRLEFEDWIIEVLLHGIMNERRNEMGFDGYRTFALDRKYMVMLEVKSGNASPTQLNHFIMTVKDKKGDMGVFICFTEQITRNMQLIAKKEGLFTDDIGNTYSDKIQIISVEDLLEGKRPQIPQSKYETFKKAEKKSTDNDTQIKFEL